MRRQQWFQCKILRKNEELDRQPASGSRAVRYRKTAIRIDLPGQTRYPLISFGFGVKETP
jgi:hypothetical protein